MTVFKLISKDYKMNPRVKELAEQAGGVVLAGSEIQKFAELIVKECAIIAKNKQYKHSPAHSVGDCAAAIREHFGVK